MCGDSIRGNTVGVTQQRVRRRVRWCRGWDGGAGETVWRDSVGETETVGRRFDAFTFTAEWAGSCPPPLQ